MFKVLSLEMGTLLRSNKIDMSENDFPIDKMGTSGLRKEQAYWTRNRVLRFAQGVADYYNPIRTRTGQNVVVVGGDPRVNNDWRMELFIGVMLANHFVVVTSHDGQGSTPALSALILRHNALFGALFTASHNPATDAGIKLNGKDGGGILDQVAEDIFKSQNQVTSVSWVGFKFAQIHQFKFLVEPVDIRDEYVQQLRDLIDFEYLKSELKLRSDITIAVDAKGGAAGPFVQYILSDILGLSQNQYWIENGDPDPELGGTDAHPEPAVQYMIPFIKRCQEKGVTMGVSFDTDVDRRLVFGSGKTSPVVLGSADEFAMTALALAEHPEWFKSGIDRVFDWPERGGMNPSGRVRLGRSIVTAPALDYCMAAINAGYQARGFSGAESLITPTGFKYINSYCKNWGVEESNGAGVFSDPANQKGISEKDGIFHFLLSLTIVLKSGQSLEQRLMDHWSRFGQTGFARGEISDPNASAQDQQIYSDRLNAIQNRVGDTLNGYFITSFENKLLFHDPEGKAAPLDMKTWKIQLKSPVGDDVAVFARFSGTGSKGYTLRLYVHTHTMPDATVPNQFNQSPIHRLKEIRHVIDQLLTQGERASTDWTFESEAQLVA